MSHYTTGQWKQMPKGYFEGVSDVLVIFGETVSWISARKMKETADEAWKDDKRNAERNGGGYDAWPPTNLRQSVNYLSEHRPGLKIAREMNENVVVRGKGEQRETD